MGLYDTFKFECVCPRCGKKNNEGFDNFSEFYVNKMEGFIEHLKTKLD